MRTWKTYRFKLFDFNPSSYCTIIQLLQSVEHEIPILFDMLTKETFLEKIEWCDWLDVGAGLGDPVFPFMDFLHNNGKQIRYDYLDPSDNAFSLFNRRLMSNNLNQILNDVFIEKWEKHQPKRKYDIITFFHSAYYIDYWDTQRNNSLTKALGALKNDGRLCFVHLSKNSDYLKILPLIQSNGKTNKPPICVENLRSLCDRLSSKPQIKMINLKLDVKNKMTSINPTSIAIVEFFFDCGIHGIDNGKWDNLIEMLMNRPFLRFPVGIMVCKFSGANLAQS